jgi:hypothetical protein
MSKLLIVKYFISVIVASNIFPGKKMSKFEIKAMIGHAIEVSCMANSLVMDCKNARGKLIFTF